jgi:hypothetical protein
MKLLSRGKASQNRSESDIGESKERKTYPVIAAAKQILSAKVVLFVSCLNPTIRVAGQFRHSGMLLEKKILVRT